MRTVSFAEEEIQAKKDTVIAGCERNIKYYANLVKDTFKKS
jgi:hypothetical protein